MQQVVYQFPQMTKEGLVMVQLGQCFRTNDFTKKIFHFTTGQGYITWVMAVSRDVNLEFRELREAFDKALEFVGVSRKDIA